MVGSVSFPVENDVLHGFYVAVLAHTSLFIVCGFEPVLAAFMDVMDRTPVDRSRRFFMAVSHILSSEGRVPSRSYVASLMRSRFEDAR